MVILPLNLLSQIRTKIAIISDIHYMDESLLIADGTKFQEYLAKDRKLIKESASILRSAVREMINLKPHVILIPGDLTKDGELISHQKLTQELDTLLKLGIKVFVVPGNHDVNTPDAVAYDGDTTYSVPTIDTATFRDLYKNFGYNQAISKDTASLSYVVNLDNQTVLIAIDACTYYYNDTLTHSSTKGQLRPQVYQWIIDRIREAKLAGKNIFGMMHHGLVQHFQGQSIAFSEYVIEGWDTIATTFANEGMQLIFTGHFHANDITAFTTSQGKKIYDIETGSLVTYPCPYRVCYLMNDNTFEITTKYITEIDIPVPGGDFQQYAYTYLKEGMTNLVKYVLIQPVSSGGYGLNPIQANIIAPYIVNGFIAHYAGDEILPDSVNSFIHWLKSAGINTLANYIQSLYTDLPPSDNKLLINLTTGTILPAISYRTYKNFNSPIIGLYNGISIRETGGSGLAYIPGTEREFWTLGDRGPNLDAINHPQSGGKDVKVFPFPNYNPKIFKVKLEGDSIKILSSVPIKTPWNSSVTGLPNPVGIGNTGEIGWAGTAPEDINNPLGTDTLGIDPEGITIGPNGDLFICDEYGVSVWRVNPVTGKLIERYSPFKNIPPKYKNITIDTIFVKRRPNRGFEGITTTPNGKIYVVLQSPMLNPNDKSRIVRLLELEPYSKSTKMYAVLLPNTTGSIRVKDWKIGDITAINNHEFLAIVHGVRTSGGVTTDRKMIMKWDIRQATPIIYEKYVVSGVEKTLEQLVEGSDTTALTKVKNGKTDIVPVQQSLFLELYNESYPEYPSAKNIWDPRLDKPEGIVILNDSTIIVTNDNDFGVTSPNEDGNAEPNLRYWMAFEYHLPADKKLNTYNTPTPQFSLQLLHSSDLEGGVDAIARAPLFASVMEKLQQEHQNTITISSGDNYIPSPFFNAASDERLNTTLRNVYSDFYNDNIMNKLRTASGRVDVSIMNICGFDASALGNHEFDAGPAVMREIINIDYRTTPELRWIGTQFPYLSANLDFSQESSLAPIYHDAIENNTYYQNLPQKISNNNYTTQKIAPATYVVRGNEKIGIVGVTTPIVQSISSTGQVKVKGVPENNMDTVAFYVQQQIDRLRNNYGINKIIVVSHLQQIALEKELIKKLSGVDIIVGGGSDYLMAKAGDLLLPGDIANSPYPYITHNKDNEPAILVNTKGQYGYIGRLVVDFTADGIIDTTSISPLSGVYAAHVQNVVTLWGDSASGFTLKSKGELVKRLVNAVEQVVIEQDGNIFGKTLAYLNGERSSVRREETNLGNLTADANLWYAQKYDPEVKVSLKNGGGIRASIGEIRKDSNDNYLYLPPQANPLVNKQNGDISQLDITNSLRFNNSLTILELTVAELKMILEHGVAAWTPTATPGQFCQIGGMAISFDPSATPQMLSKNTNGTIIGIAQQGERIRSLVILNENNEVEQVLIQNGKIVTDPNTKVKMVTLQFLADGGDDYPFVLTANYANRVNLNSAEATGDATFAKNGTEQDALAEYLKLKHWSQPFAMADTKVEEDNRIQNMRFRQNGLIFPVPYVNTPIADCNLRYKIDTLSIDLTLVFNMDNTNQTSEYTIAYDQNVLQIVLQDNSVRLIPKAVGNTQVIIKTADRYGMIVCDTFVATVLPNNPPVLVNSPENDTIFVGSTKVIEGYPLYFSDPENQMLNFEVVSSNENVAKVSFSNQNLAITALNPGTAIITLSADDRVNLPVSISFTIEVIDTSTNIGTISSAERIIFGPNPANDYIKIESDAILMVRIINLSGNTILETNNKIIDITKLSRGIYTLQVFTRNGIYVEKFIKN